MYCICNSVCHRAFSFIGKENVAADDAFLPNISKNVEDFPVVCQCLPMLIDDR